jgi:predicted transposase YbfD/YdcC
LQYVAAMAKSSASTPRLLFDEHFAALDDPRDPDKTEHSLRNILLLALAAVLCGATGWDEIALIARERAAALHDLLDPADGTPSADTFRRVFEVLHPDVFADCLANWVASLQPQLAGEVVAFDGKAHRGTARDGRRPLYSLHAWATRQRLLLRSATVGGAPEEVAGIVAMLRVLSVAGAVVTTDANGCTRAVAQASLDAGAAYLLALKRNRAALFAAVVAAFAAHPARSYDATVNRGHGRVECRQVWTLPAQVLGPAAPTLPGLRALVRVVRMRITATGTAIETMYYVTSLAPRARRLADAIRAHWGIENHLHHALDVVFGEDSSRVHDRIAADNLGSVRRMASTLLRKDTAALSLVMKTRRAGLNTDYLRHLLMLGGN